ncbi:GNAT superfamily N-acetyltransferase [Dysgonomonadaceae bacterium PH5-43]|nr:GNAT superfamily N-acetyltransferase [Dysgonomonadaceae bacterium PH5-43]
MAIISNFVIFVCKYRAIVLPYRRLGAGKYGRNNAEQRELQKITIQYQSQYRMTIQQVTQNKKQYLDLLLLGDEQESMIDRYLDSGDMFALYDEELKAVCVVAHIDKGVCELKNIAVYQHSHRQGYGKALISYISTFYKDKYNTMLVGTGETPSVLAFYKRCGFALSHRVKNFFTDNYDHLIFEEGVQLVDMIYLTKELR